MGQDSKAFGIRTTTTTTTTPLDDLQFPPALLFAPSGQLLARVSSICPDLVQTGHKRLYSSQKTMCPDPILCVRRSDVNRERKAHGVHQKVALAPLDILVGVVAARVGRFFDGLDALGIQDGRRRLGILAYPLPLGCVQDLEDEGPQPTQSRSPDRKSVV